MGKSEILMLLAGVALSIMLAMIAVPMFSSGNDMANRQQVQQDLMSIKSSIPLVLALEGDAVGTFTPNNLVKHVNGITVIDNAAGTIRSKLNDVTYDIDDSDPTRSTITVSLTVPHAKYKLDKLSRMDSICDSTETTPYVAAVEDANPQTVTCKIKR